MARKRNSEEVEASSGNVFADLGLPNADEEQTKVRLAVAINQAIRDLTQVEASKKLGTKQPNVSALRNYRLSGFSAERLMHFLNALEYDVNIVIQKKPRWKKFAGIAVTGAAALALPGLRRAMARGRERRLARAEGQKRTA